MGEEEGRKEKGHDKCIMYMYQFPIRTINVMCYKHVVIKHFKIGLWIQTES